MNQLGGRKGEGGRFGKREGEKVTYDDWREEERDEGWTGKRK